MLMIAGFACLGLLARLSIPSDDNDLRRDIVPSAAPVFQYVTQFE